MSFVFDPHSIVVALQERNQLTCTDFILRVSHSFPAAAVLTGISVLAVPLGAEKLGILCLGPMAVYQARRKGGTWGCFITTMAF